MYWNRSILEYFTIAGLYKYFLFKTSIKSKCKLHNSKGNKIKQPMKSTPSSEKPEKGKPQKGDPYASREREREKGNFYKPSCKYASQQTNCSRHNAVNL